MSRIFKNGWFQRFARKQGLDDEILLEAIVRAESGLIDADLGSGLIKQRVARPGGGRSGGFRTLIIFQTGDRAIFAYGFAKSDRGNISAADLKLLKRAAAEALGWTDEELNRLVEAGALTEIGHDPEG
jgi:hypothetical protein